MKNIILLPLILIIFMTILLSLSFVYESYLLFIISLLGVVVNVGLYVFLIVLKYKKQEENIDYKKLQEIGLHIVSCPNCGKTNVLEDLWCVKCGEKLSDENIK